MSDAAGPRTRPAPLSCVTSTLCEVCPATTGLTTDSHLNTSVLAQKPKHHVHILSFSCKYQSYVTYQASCYILSQALHVLRYDLIDLILSSIIKNLLGNKYENHKEGSFCLNQKAVIHSCSVSFNLQRTVTQLY